MNLAKILQKAQQIIKSTSNFIGVEATKIQESDIHIKQHNNLVSYVDTTAEKMLVDGLGQIIPDSGFLTEEETTTIINKEFEWIIDPLDGTTNFIYGVPAYCVSVALRHQEKIVMGLVHDVVFDKCYSAIKGKGAFLEKKPIHVSKRNHLNEALIATGFPYYDFSKQEKYLKVFTHLIENTRGIRRFGSAALDLCHVARGTYDGFYEHSLHAWDIAAGALILLEAGGLVSDFHGGKTWLFGGEIVAANPAIHKELVALTNKHFQGEPIEQQFKVD